MGELTCHICEAATDFTCDQCKEPVCEDCCVQMTTHTQIDYPLCTECQESNETADYAERSQEWARQEAVDKKKAKVAARRKATYWKPENVEKRRLAKAKRKAEKIERDREMMKAAVQFIGSAFRGMF